LQTSLADVTDSLTKEISERVQADTAVATQAQTNLDSVKADLQSQINSLQLLDTNVKLTGPMLFTKTFGKYTPDSTGSVSVGEEGMTIRELFLDAFSEQSVGTIDYPSYSYTAGSHVTGEVGSTYTLPSATFKVTDVGSY
jgi:hypothetical protein